MAPRSIRRIKRRKVAPEDGSNGIFRLPEDVLKHILFYLPYEDSISLSAVSKTWQRICNSLPVYKFNFDLDEEEDTNLQDFITSINTAMSAIKDHRAIIETFRLKMNPSEEEGLKLKSDVDYWLSLILKNHVKEIDLGFSNDSHNNIYFTVPQSIFTSKSLVKLHLKGCKFPTNVSLTGGHIDEFNCLKEISLVKIIASDDQIHELINLARSFLENLLIKTSPSMNLLILESFSELEFLEVRVKKLYINQAMKLDNVVIYGLKTAYINGVDNIRTIRCVRWHPSALRSIQELVARLPFLETLQLFMLRNHHERIRIESEHLKMLLLYEGRRFEEPLEVDVVAPELGVIKFNGFYVPFITVFGVNQKLRCRHLGHPHGGVRGSHLHLLGKFSQNLMQSMAIIHLHGILMTEDGENVVKTLEELREEPEVARPSTVKMLVLECIPAASDYKSFLNALFWTCHPRTLALMLTSKHTMKSPHRPPFISYLLNELVRRREKNPRCCWEANKPKCWKHYVAQVKFNVYRYSMLKHFGEQDGNEELLDLLTDDDYDHPMPQYGNDDDVTSNKDDEEEDEDEKGEEKELVVVFKIVWRPYPYNFHSRSIRHA